MCVRIMSISFERMPIDRSPPGVLTYFRSPIELWMSERNCSKAPVNTPR